MSRTCRRSAPPRGYVVRSPHAHARIVAIDAARARAAPGVLAVLTGADLERRGLGTLRPLIPRRKKNGAPAFVCPQPLLAQERVRYVGQPVAFVVAETLDQAKDAAELLAIDYETAAGGRFGRGGGRAKRARGVGRQPRQRGLHVRGRRQGRDRRRVRARLRTSCATRSSSTG